MASNHRTSPRRRHRILLAIALTVSLGAVACTSADEATPPTATDRISEPTTTSTTSNGPVATTEPSDTTVDDTTADSVDRTASSVRPEPTVEMVASFPAMPRDVTALLTGGFASPDNITFASGTPFNDLEYTLFDTLYIEGETSGYDTFMPVDTADDHPGANQIRIVNAVSNPAVDNAYAGAPGDRIILGLPGGKPFFRSPDDDTDDDYVIISNLDYTNGHIQLPGVPADYRLLYGDTDAGAATTGWYLFYIGDQTADLIAFVFPCDDIAASSRPGPEPTPPNDRSAPPQPDDALLCNDTRQLDLDDTSQFRFVNVDDSEAPYPDTATQIGTAGTEIVTGITTDDNGARYLFGSTDGNLDGQQANTDNDVFVTKLDRAGDTQWVTEIATANGGLIFDAVADDEHLYAVGRTFGALDGFQSAGVWDAIIIKMRLDTGDVVATDQWGNSGIDGYGAVTLDDDGNLYVSGAGSPPGSTPDPTGAGDPFFVLAKHSTDTLTNQWRLLDAVLPDSSTVAEAWSGVTYIPGEQPGGGRVLTGGWFRNPPNGADGFLALYTNLDTTTPTRQATHIVQSDGIRADWVFDHAAAPNGNIYAVGATTGALDDNTPRGDGDAYIMRLDASLDSPLVVQVATTSADLFGDVVVADDGTVYAVGYTYGDLDCTNADPTGHTADVLVMRFDAELNQLASTCVGTASEERAGLDIHGDTIVLGGMTESHLATTSAGSFDAFVLTLDRSTLEPIETR